MSKKREADTIVCPPMELVATPLQRHPPTLMPSPDALPTEWPTNYNMATVEGRAGIINAGNPARWLPQDGGVHRIVAHNWVVYPDERQDEETGEVKQFARVCLIAADGTNVKFSSEFGVRRLHAVVEMFTPAEWKAGIVFECYTGKSRRPGRSDYGSFRVIGVQADDDPK